MRKMEVLLESPKYDIETDSEANAPGKMTPIDLLDARLTQTFNL